MRTRAPREIRLDLDATDDPLHGHQEGRFFHGYYRCYCYLPLYIFCGEHLPCARLRESNQDASAGTIEELERIVGQIRRHWPRTRIHIRGDSGFCRDSLMKWCEDHDVGFRLRAVSELRAHLETKEFEWRDKTGRLIAQGSNRNVVRRSQADGLLSCDDGFHGPSSVSLAFT